jgi:hypothetical protein
MNRDLKLFVIGLVAGVALTCSAGTFFFAGRMRALGDQAAGAIGTQNQALLIEQQATGAWRGRAETCEARFAVGTIVYDPGAEAPLLTAPLADGAVDIQIRAGNLFSDHVAVPAWFIPAQVDVYTNVRGASFAWQDMRTGRVLGAAFPALPPSEIGKVERARDPAAAELQQMRDLAESRQ